MPPRVSTIFVTKKKYDANNVNATKSFKKIKKTKYVLQELKFFVQQLKVNEEKSRWGWSPLHHLLKRYPLDFGPQCPWNTQKQNYKTSSLKWKRNHSS
jgi:hypothetical protein